MNKINSREIAMNHLKSSWDYIYKCVIDGKANDEDYEYDYNRIIFLRSLQYIEGFDRRYKEDGILKMAIDENYAE